MSSKPVNNQTKNGNDPVRKALVELYTAVLKQLIVVSAVDNTKREARHQRLGQSPFNYTASGIQDNASLPFLSLELSLGRNGRDRALEASVAELVRLRTVALSYMSDEDVSDDEDAKRNIDGGHDDDDNHDEVDGLDDDDSRNGDFDASDPDRSRKRDRSQADVDSQVSSDDSGGSSNDSSSSNGSKDSSAQISYIQSKLCAYPEKEPLFSVHDGLSDVAMRLYFWASQQAEYQTWCRAGIADDADSDHRILWLIDSEGSDMSTLLLDALVQAELGGLPTKTHDGRSQYAVARATWDWSRDVHGASVVSILRDLVWSVLVFQPELTSHLETALKVTGRQIFLGGDGDRAEAQCAAFGTSYDFYSMLALLCRIIGDPAFEPTCFVVDFLGELPGAGDDAGEVETGGSYSAWSARRRDWMLHDLQALVHTTCRLSSNVAWIISPSPSLSSSSSSSFSSSNVLTEDEGGCRLFLSPIDPLLTEIMRQHVRCLLETRTKPGYSPIVLDELVSEITLRAHGNVTWSKMVVDRLARVALPWNAIYTLQDLPDGSQGLGPLLDWMVSDSVNDSSNSNDQELIDAVLCVAALAFQPLTILEVAALAALPATVEAAVLINALARQLLDTQEVDVWGRQAQPYVYFPNRSVLATYRASLAKATSMADLHADMALRHLRCLVEYYSHPDSYEDRPLSLYMKLSWLRHLARVDIGHVDVGRSLPHPLTDVVCAFVAQNSGVWLQDMYSLQVMDIARSLMQDMLWSTYKQQQLSPIEVALTTLDTRLSRVQVLGLSPADAERFLRVAGYDSDGTGKVSDESLPVLPQAAPISLPGIQKYSGHAMAESDVPIATIEGHEDWVRDTTRAYNDRLIISVSDDGLLRIWDRASCRVQQVTKHTLTEFPREVLALRSRPNVLLARGKRSMVRFDLADGAIYAKEGMNIPDSVSAWRQQQKIERKRRQGQLESSIQKSEGEQNATNAADDDVDDVDDDAGTDVSKIAEDVSQFSSFKFAEVRSRDIIVTCKAGDGDAEQLVMGTPGFDLKEVRSVKIGYESIPKDLADTLSDPENYKDAAVADNVGLAAIVHSDGDLLVYSTDTLQLLQRLHYPWKKFTGVRYVSIWSVFATKDESERSMFHFIDTRRGWGQQKGEATKPIYKSYRTPLQDFLSCSVSRDGEEAIFTSRERPLSVYRIVGTNVDADADSPTVTAAEDNVPDTGFATSVIASLQEWMTNILFSHDGLLVATSNNVGVVQIWKVPDPSSSESEAFGAPQMTLWHTIRTTESEINWLAFSGDDTMLLGCYDNGQTDVWFTATGERIAYMGGVRSFAFCATFSPENKLVGTALYNGLICLWDLGACQRTYRETNGAASGSCEGEVLSSSDNSVSFDGYNTRYSLSHSGGYNDEDDSNGSDDDDQEDGNGKQTDYNLNHHVQGTKFADIDEVINGDIGSGSYNKTISVNREKYLPLEGRVRPVTGELVFSPDGRFVVVPSGLGFIWDISPDALSNSVLPSGPIKPCATLRSKAEAFATRIDTHGKGDDDDISRIYGPWCKSCAFSPDSQMLFGLCSRGRVLVWKRKPGASPTDSTSPLVSSVGGVWEEQALLIAIGFEAPSPLKTCIYEPRRLFVSADEHGKHFLHTEIGVWSVPQASEKGTAALKPSPRHPCNIVRDESHTENVEINWREKRITKLPSMYAPSDNYFGGIRCDIHTVDTSTSNVVIGSMSGSLLFFRFQAREASSVAEGGDVALDTDIGDGDGDSGSQTKDEGA